MAARRRPAGTLEGMESTQLRLARRPEGEPDDTTFSTTTETLPALQDGQVALAIRLSLTAAI